jgi:putative ABC transport system permease protein
MSAFRVALRISRRNAWRAKRRSALILTMIALPVLVATFVASASFDGTIDDHSGMPLGQADAMVSGSPDLAQAAEDESGEAPPKARPFTAAEVIEMFGPGSRAVQVDQGFLRFLTPQGFRSDMVHQADLRDPLFRGTYRLLDGRLPAAPGEIVVNTVMNQGPSSGPGTGQTFFAGHERVPLRVVGDVLMPQGWPPTFVGFPGSFPASILDDAGPGGTTLWMVDAPRAVSLADAHRLRARGAQVVSPAAPDESQEVVATSTDNSVDLEPVPWIAMMLLEVVLLAGPAFAVGQRRRTKEFALISAQGGSPRQLKRIALADGLLFGTCASVIGAVAGIGVAALVKPSLAVDSNSLEESISVPWPAVAIIMSMGIVAGLLASLAPAERASRTDVVAVLTGRRTPGRDRAGRPVPGLVLIVAGLTGTAVGARYGVVWIASAALITQLGLVAVLPWLIAKAGRLAGVLPFPLRFAVRDAARNRGRTVPAVAAVMAAVTLFTALGVGWRSSLSDPPVVGPEYPQGPPGALWIQGQDLGPELWGRVRTKVRAALPGVPVIEAEALVASSGEQFQVDVPSPDSELDPDPMMGAEKVDPSGNGGLLVGDERMLRYVLGRDDPSAAAALRAGKAVALNPVDVRRGRVHISLVTSDSDHDVEVTLPAISVRATGQGWARVVISPETVKKLGYATDTALLVVDPADYRVAPATARRLLSDVGQMSSQVTGRLEVPQPPDDRPILVTLGAAAAVLVLGMTFVSTGLAAAEAKPDLAVMSAVGAAPRMRRRVKAGQALVIALAGAVIGVLAGLVAGVAAGWPRPHARASRPLFGADGIRIPPPHEVIHMIVVPWSLIALLVVGLPLLAALVCGMFTRSRLPAPRRRPA